MPDLLDCGTMGDCAAGEEDDEESGCASLHDPFSHPQKDERV